jgi:tRNA threonylcarbamoyl adenosine modification protein YjeE
MKIFKARSSSPEETKRLARVLSGIVPSGTYIMLEGGLGSGKTTFVSGYADGGRVSSPSFVLSNIYRVPAGSGRECAGEVRHVDLWRLPSGADVSDIFAVDDTRQNESIVWLVEWADRLPRDFAPSDNTISIKITIPRSSAATSGRCLRADGDNESAGRNGRRDIRLKTDSKRLGAVIHKLRRAFGPSRASRRKK